MEKYEISKKKMDITPMTWASLNFVESNDFQKISVRTALHARLQGQTTSRN